MEYNFLTYGGQRLIPFCFVRSNSPISVRKSSKRYFERRIMHAWKAMTRATHKQPRASFVPPDFVLVTKRRSIMHLNRAGQC